MCFARCSIVASIAEPSQSSWSKPAFRTLRLEQRPYESAGFDKPQPAT